MFTSGETPSSHPLRGQSVTTKSQYETNQATHTTVKHFEFSKPGRWPVIGHANLPKLVTDFPNKYFNLTKEMS